MFLALLFALLPGFYFRIIHYVMHPFEVRIYITKRITLSLAYSVYSSKHTISPIFLYHIIGPRIKPRITNKVFGNEINKININKKNSKLSNFIINKILVN